MAFNSMTVSCVYTTASRVGIYFQPNIAELSELRPVLFSDHQLNAITATLKLKASAVGIATKYQRRA
jgi:hypothetical protein